jgi:hypothetical protein
VTSLDDLLGYDDAPRRRKRRLSPRVRFGLAVGGVLVLARVIVRALRSAYQVDAPYVFVASALLCMLGLYGLLRVLNPPRLPEALRDAPPEPPALSTADDGVRDAMIRWVARLEWTRDDIARFDTMVKPGLVDIVDERLRLVHGVSRTTDPQRAQAIVPAPLWSFIHEPVTRMNPTELATLVAQMEAL